MTDIALSIQDKERKYHIRDWETIKGNVHKILAEGETDMRDIPRVSLAETEESDEVIGSYRGREVKRPTLSKTTYGA